MEYRFQVNLAGLIDLLSNHLYSNPQVFVRELLQNAVDALRARSKIEPQHQGNITIEVTEAQANQPATLAFIDDGVGLTEEEIHLFLATIGQSSKKDELATTRNDFLGQFGIGLLSCFMVSDEIVVLTQSIQPNTKTIEWRGKADGTYAIRTLEKNLTPGTRVYLRSKKGYEEYYKSDRVSQQANHFGSLLPYPIRVTVAEKTQVINGELPPWKQTFSSRHQQHEATLNYGRKTLGIDCVDYIPLNSAIGGVEGVAFILAYSPSPATKPSHRVYLKNMLLSEQADNILPEWAFFVKAIINVNDLRPTASRESFYEDAQLLATRSLLGQCIRDYLLHLAQTDTTRLENLINLHFLAIKGLAVHDDEFYRIFIDLLPFETSLGRMTMGEYKQQNSVIRYVPTLDQFRQIAQVAASQSISIINAGYVYDRELLAKHPYIFPETPTEEIDPTTLTYSLEDLTLEERKQIFNLIKIADLVLQPFKCSAQIKKFLPQELPSLYSLGKEGEWQRQIMQSKEITNNHWQSVLDSVAAKPNNLPYAQLCFNFNNPLIRQLSGVSDPRLLELTIQMLYTQALLLGHHPLSSKEMRLLNNGLLNLISISLKGG